jgi:hypothetical protein
MSIRNMTQHSENENENKERPRVEWRETFFLVELVVSDFPDKLEVEGAGSVSSSNSESVPMCPVGWASSEDKSCKSW